MTSKQIDPELDPTNAEAASAARNVPTRRVQFAPSFDDVPKHFCEDGDVISSHFVAALTSVFPDGEDFFVRSVRHYRSEITDPVLKKQVGGFIGQESIHGREHRDFNDRLAELGYPTKQVETLTRKGLALRSRFAPAKANLATTAALEHFTATIAEHLLTCEETRQQLGHDAVRDLFVWHALEESEHKAVAFDVYRAIGGSERLRIWTMKFIRIGFIIGIALQMLVSLAMDREARKPRVLFKSWKRAKRSPIFSREIWDQLKEYDEVGFHPNDRDTDDLVEQWTETLFGVDGSLSDKLAGATKAA